MGTVLLRPNRCVASSRTLIPSSRQRAGDRACRRVVLGAIAVAMAVLLAPAGASATTVINDDSDFIVNSYNGSNGAGAAALITDATATNGTCARFTVINLPFQHYMQCPPGGRYRFTLRGKVTSGVGPVLLVECWSSADSIYLYHARTWVDFSDVTPAMGWTERYCDILLPTSTGNWCLNVNAAANMDVDWDKLETAPAGLYPAVEAVGVSTGKLLYKTTEAGTVTAKLLNATGSNKTAELRIRVESGTDTTQTIYDQTVTVGGTGIPINFTVPLPALSAAGRAVIAEIISGGQVVSSTRDYFYSSDLPAQVTAGYGVYNMGGDPYTWNYADSCTRAMRQSYCALVEMDFWAPCDMSMLVAPAGQTKWWSGQTLARLSTQEVQTYVSNAKAAGIGFVGYVDYSLAFGYRILDAARSYPQMLDWDTENNYYVWHAYSMAGAAAPGSPQRLENDAAWSSTGPDGVARIVPSSHKALKWHGDQLAAAIAQSDWAGFRYDDPINYEAAQVDMLGRNAPFTGWSNEAMMKYFKDRLAAAKPGAVFGHNTDPFQTFDPWDSTARGAATEAAVMRGGSGFLLQEGYSNSAFSSKKAWTDFRDKNITGGLRAHPSRGQVYVIIDMPNAANDVEKEHAAAVITAAGNHMAYNFCSAPYLQFICRNSDLLYSDKVDYLSATGLLSVTGAGTAWWQNYVRCYYKAPGTRQYYVHLLNPPSAANMGTSGAADPAAINNITLNWTFPAGWTPTKAFAVTADVKQRTLCFTDKIPNQTYDPNVVQDGFIKLPTATPLTLNGSSVTLPQLAKWSIVVVECSGPTNDLPTGPALNLPAEPTVPDVTQPDTGTTFAGPMTVLVADDKWGDYPTGSAALDMVSDANAVDGLAMRCNSNVRSTDQVQHYNLPAGMHPAGHYRLTLRARTEVTGKKITLQVQNSTQDPVFYLVSGSFDMTGVTAAQGYRDYVYELDFGETRVNQAVNLTNCWTGLVIDRLTVERISLKTDSQRLPLMNETTWPTPAPTKLTHSGVNVWYGNGLYYQYFKIEEALNNLGKTINLEMGKNGVYGAGLRYWGGTAFPATADALAQKDLVVLANVPADTTSAAGMFGWRDWLRGYVQNGGRLLILGGPYGFGRGGWSSDLVQAIMPVTISPALINGISYDLQGIGETSPVALTPQSGLARGVSWSTTPKVMWMHNVTAKSGATVDVKAGTMPAVARWKTGNGKVAVVMTAPLGDAPAGQTAFWNWSQWQTLMQKEIEWLLSDDASMDKVDAPSMSPPPGTYPAAVAVTLTTGTVGATIRYTTDGTVPSRTVGTIYSGTPVPVSRTTTIKAIAYLSGMTDSDVTIGVYSFTVVGRYAFYNNSKFDKNNPAANADDDTAIATNKTPLLPGGTATFANYTSYSRGINGIMVDIASLPAGNPTAADFTLKVGNSNDPTTWATAPAPTSITVRRGAGAGGSDRITLIWADNAIQKQWLQVTVKATAATGIAAPDVFYFGNAIGETGNSATDAMVTPTDQVAARNDPHTLTQNPADITNNCDFNRDGKVGPTDEVIARNNGTNAQNALKLITVPP